MPEWAYGPTNNCIGIGDVLRRRGHRVVFAAEASWEGRLEALGFEEDLVDLAPPSRRRRRRAGRRPVLEGLHPRHRAGVPQADDRAARDVHPADLAGADRRARSTASRSCSEIIERAAARRDRRGQRRRLPGADHRGAPFVRIVSCNPLEMHGRRRPAGVLRLLPADDRAEWEAFRAEYDRTHREMWSDVQRVGAVEQGAPAAARPRVHPRVASTLNLYVYPARSPTTPTRGRSTPTWHRLDSRVRDDRRAVRAAGRARRPARRQRWSTCRSARSASPTSS